MSFLSKFNKKEKEKNIELATNGFAINEIRYENQDQQKSRIQLCLIRGVLVFLGSFGTVGAMVSGFGISYYVVPVALISLAISMYIAFIYYNRLTFYVGYILLFIIFLSSIFSFYWYVNSGYQAYMNIVHESYGDYFFLSSVQEAVEFIENRLLTVSITMVFVSAFLSILLNITISGSMSLIGTFLVTFPLVQISLYIEKKPSIVYLVMLMSVYITVAVLGRSGHYKLPDYRSTNQQFLTTKTSKNQINHTYISDGAGILNTMLYSVALSVIFLLITTGMFFMNLDSQHTSNKLKNTTDQYVKAVAQNGIWSILDRYNAKGGLSGGRLGGIGSVRPDYEPDLYVTFAPTSFEPVYLRAFVGTNYTGLSFETDITEYRNRLISLGIESTSYMADTYAIADHVPLNNGEAYMEILNVDADLAFDYMPYYSYQLLSREMTTEGLSYSVLYSPYDEYVSDINIPNEEYRNFAYDNYLNVPEEIQDTLDDILYEIDLENFRNQFEKASVIHKREMIDTASEEITNYFYDNYYYTMAPGTTPRNEDFVEYFLTNQKRGFCAHFAASATLLLRELGIPARYCEGYVITPTNIIDGTPLPEKDVDEYIDENVSTDFDTGVMEVEITDGSAHAWTEVYLDGYGWVVMDFTPPSTEDIVYNNNFPDIFRSLFMTGLGRNANAPVETLRDTSNDEAFDNFRINLNSSLSFILVPLAIISLFTITVIILYRQSHYIVLIFRIKKALKKEEYNKAIMYRYVAFSEKITRTTSFKPGTIATELLNGMLIYGIEEAIIKDLTEAINQALYSNNNMDKETYNYVTVNLKAILKKLKKMKVIK